MSSINTNPAAMVALRTLESTNMNLEQVQKRISTGFRVSEASDNAAYWSIATAMRSDNKALSTVQDALGLGAAKIDISYTSTNSAIDVVDEIKTKLVAAREPGVDRTKVQNEIGELQNQLKAIADSASFSGENWLSVDSSSGTYVATKQIVASFNRNASGVAVSTIDIDTTSLALYDANAGATGLLDTTFTTTGGGAVTVSVSDLDITAANIDNTDIDQMITNVDNAIASLTGSASDMGAVKRRISMQKDFVGSLMDAITRGVGTLVDADMTAESTRLQALQTQQQLGIQSLSIANSTAQNLLALFK